MDLLEKYYDEQVFMLYALFARVPGKSPWARALFVTLGIPVLTFAVVFQSTKLLTDGWKVQLVIELLPTVTSFAMCLLFLLYLTFSGQKEYKAILSIMLNDLTEARCEEEGAIKRRYARSARIIINAYKIGIAAATCGLPLLGFVPYFLDAVIPLSNETRRERQLLYEGEMFVDQGEYFYVIYLVEISTVLVLCIVVGVSEIMGVIIGQHLCGMFAEIGYRLESITRVNAKMSRADLIDMRLEGCIKKHQQVLVFAELASKFYDIPLTLILIETFCSLTVSLVQVTDPELISAKMVMFTVLEISQFFVVSVMGERAINASESTSWHAYNAEWDVCSGSARKSLQLMILRSSVPCEVVARGMYTLSIGNFVSVMQTATSFYMVLRQVQASPSGTDDDGTPNQ